MNVRQQLIGFEGRVHQAYPDPISKDGKPWTIGVGHTGPEVHRGLVWTDEQIDDALDQDIDIATTACRKTWKWFESLNEPRQAVLIGMVFQMGLAGTKQFRRALACMRDRKYRQAALEMADSQWAKQTPERAWRMCLQMYTGEWW